MVEICWSGSSRLGLILQVENDGIFLNESKKKKKKKKAMFEREHSKPDPAIFLQVLTQSTENPNRFHLANDTQSSLHIPLHSNSIQTNPTLTPSLVQARNSSFDLFVYLSAPHTYIYLGIRTLTSSHAIHAFIDHHRKKKKRLLSKCLFDE